MKNKGVRKEKVFSRSIICTVLIGENNLWYILVNYSLSKAFYILTEFNKNQTYGWFTNNILKDEDICSMLQIKDHWYLLIKRYVIYRDNPIRNLQAIMHVALIFDRNYTFKCINIFLFDLLLFSHCRVHRKIITWERNYHGFRELRLYSFFLIHIIFLCTFFLICFCNVSTHHCLFSFYFDLELLTLLLVQFALINKCIA